MERLSILVADAIPVRIHPAGLIQKRACLLRVVGVLEAVFTVAPHGRRHGAPRLSEDTLSPPHNFYLSGETFTITKTTLSNGSSFQPPQYSSKRVKIRRCPLSYDSYM